ncbi:type II toxin-antitoxin system ParD family antitoxin [Scytonema sp. NUACC26]|uniref:type II toxin-antitoxin system ParD family antitoxin n=1 Tax=Scytonema sp. NUACC26 TaxID=3140176 RepID=UPI0034DBA64B
MKGITRSRSLVMNVSLTPELEQFVREKVKIGRYPSASEVVREALRLLEERDRSSKLSWKLCKRKLWLELSRSSVGTLWMAKQSL